MLAVYLTVNTLYSLMILYRVWREREVRVYDIITCVLVILVGIILFFVVMLVFWIHMVLKVDLLDFPPLSWICIGLKRLEESKIGRKIVINKPRE
jgi:hypothetical protein